MHIMKIIGVTDLQRGFRKVIDEVAEQRVPYVLTRGSRPEAVLVPYDEYQRLQALQEKDVVYELDRLLERTAARTAEVDEDEVAADATRARREVRDRTRTE
jgi:prevent-host-death family protein